MQRLLAEAKQLILSSPWSTQIPVVPDWLVHLKHANNFAANSNLNLVQRSTADWVIPSSQERALLESSIQVYYKIGVLMQLTAVATAFHFKYNNTSLYKLNTTKQVKKDNDAVLNLILSIVSLIIAQHFTLWTPRTGEGRGKGALPRWGFNIAWLKLGRREFPKWEYKLAWLDNYFDTCLCRPQTNVCSESTATPATNNIGLTPQMAARYVAHLHPEWTHKTKVPGLFDRLYKAVINHPAYGNLLGSLCGWAEGAVREPAGCGLRY